MEVCSHSHAGAKRGAFDGECSGLGGNYFLMRQMFQQMVSSAILCRSFRIRRGICVSARERHEALSICRAHKGAITSFNIWTDSTTGTAKAQAPESPCRCNKLLRPMGGFSLRISHACFTRYRYMICVLFTTRRSLFGQIIASGVKVPPRRF